MPLFVRLHYSAEQHILILQNLLYPHPEPKNCSYEIVKKKKRIVITDVGVIEQKCTLNASTESQVSNPQTRRRSVRVPSRHQPSCLGLTATSANTLEDYHLAVAPDQKTGRGD